MALDIKGVTEETTTGVQASLQDDGDGELLFPAINVNDSVTKSKFDNLYGCRHRSSIDLAGNRRDDRRQDASCSATATSARAASSRCRAGRPGDRHRDRSDQRTPGRDGGPPGDAARRRRGNADIFVTSTGNMDLITIDSMKQMKHNAIVCNIGHFDNEIDMAGCSRSGATRDELKPGTDVWQLRRRQADHHSGRGPPGEPRLRHRPPELRDVVLVHQPGDRPDRTVQPTEATRSASTCCQSTSTRRWPGCTSTRSA